MSTKQVKKQQVLPIQTLDSAEILAPAIGAAFLGNMVVPGVGGMLVGGLLGILIGAIPTAGRK